MKFMCQQVAEEHKLILNSQKKIWPAFIPPLENEIFSSWFIRLCQSHDIKSHSFAKFYFDNSNIWNRDIDLYFSENLITEITRNTPLDVQDVKQMFLTSYKDIVYNSTSTGLINTLGIFHRKRKNFGMLFCPGCLSEENKYYKKNWRLASSTVCTKCKLNLQDSCPHCNFPICFHRLETGYKNSILKFSLDTCFNCKRSICQKFNPATSDNLLYQNYIDTTISQGFNDKAKYSFTYFQILYLFQTRIYTKSKVWSRIKNAIEKEFSYRINNEFLFSDSSNLDQRRESLYISYFLLDSWPNRFIDFYIKYDLNFSEFTKDKDLPFWFTNILKEN